MDDERLTFKEMCAAFDVTPRTLRYYEYIELLQPHREGRSRFYGPRERAGMKLILRGRKFGFALEDIRQWLLIYEKEGTEAQMRTWVTMADGQLEELAEQRRQLDEPRSRSTPQTPPPPAPDQEARPGDPGRRPHPGTDADPLQRPRHRQGAVGARRRQEAPRQARPGIAKRSGTGDLPHDPGEWAFLTYNHLSL